MFNGTVVWSADCRPFGQADVTVNTVANNFRFPGQYEDEETVLHYNWHRYYEPVIGRYLRADPFGLLTKMNLYTYSENPVTYFDPHGLFECRDRCFWFGRNAGDWQIIDEEIGTWLSSAHSFLCFYETMRRQRMKRTYRNRYLCFKFSADCDSGCRYRGLNGALVKKLNNDDGRLGKLLHSSLESQQMYVLFLRQAYR